MSLCESKILTNPIPEGYASEVSDPGFVFQTVDGKNSRIFHYPIQYLVHPVW